MPNYRLYRLDSISGHFIGVEEIRASDDMAAVDEIRQRAYGNSVELWDGGRKVTRIDPAPENTTFVQRPEAQPLH